MLSLSARAGFDKMVFVRRNTFLIMYPTVQRVNNVCSGVIQREVRKRGKFPLSLGAVLHLNWGRDGRGGGGKFSPDG